jgi:hypothetical protein
MASSMFRTLTIVAVLAGLALGPGRTDAQGILLEIRPTRGDTLHLRLEQSVEMKGTTRVGDRDSTMTVATSMAILARAIILGADSTAARVLTITDSVIVTGARAVMNGPQEHAGRDLRGSRVEMRVLPDGSSEIVSDSTALTNDVRSLVAQMPATLPRTPVQVGERWSRVVTVPVQAQGGIATTASLKTTFRFDSLSRNKEIAYVSLLGELSRTAMDSASGRSGLDMTGTIKGGITIDRKRGWMTDSRAVINLKSVLPPVRGGNTQPMHFTLTITQRMRALDKR